MTDLPMLHLDVESRSICDLLKEGAYRYWRHPSTEVLCAAYKFGHDGETLDAGAADAVGDRRPRSQRRLDWRVQRAVRASCMVVVFIPATQLAAPGTGAILLRGGARTRAWLAGQTGKGRLLKPGKNSGDYQQVNLWNGRRTWRCDGLL
jgi:hypothetical protein